MQAFRSANTQRYTNEALFAITLNQTAIAQSYVYPFGSWSNYSNTSRTLTKGKLFLLAFTPQMSGLASSVDIFSGGTGGVNFQNTYAGIYSFEGKLLASSNLLQAPSVNSIFKCPISVNLEAGIRYWIAIQCGLSTTTACSVPTTIRAPNTLPIPALGTQVLKDGLQSSLTTFDSALPTDLSGIAFIFSDTYCCGGVA